MARKPWPGDGVGRGNGAGSARTQYKSGMPSGNAKGRPRKPKPKPNPSLKDAAISALAEIIPFTENGIPRRRPRSEVMIMKLLAGFGDAKPVEMIAIMKYLAALAPEAELMHRRGRDAGAARAFLQDLGARLERQQGIEQQFSGHAGPGGPGTTA